MNVVIRCLVSRRGNRYTSVEPFYTILHSIRFAKNNRRWHLATFLLSLFLLLLLESGLALFSPFPMMKTTFLPPHPVLLCRSSSPNFLRPVQFPLVDWGLHPRVKQLFCFRWPLIPLPRCYPTCPLACRPYQKESAQLDGSFSNRSQLLLGLSPRWYGNHAGTCFALQLILSFGILTAYGW